jgi:hypothetical protein
MGGWTGGVGSAAGGSIADRDTEDLWIFGFRSELSRWVIGSVSMMIER